MLISMRVCVAAGLWWGGGKGVIARVRVYVCVCVKHTKAGPILV